MPRKFLSGGDDAMRNLVRVRITLAALLALRPAAKLGVALRSSRLGSGRLGAAFSPHLSGKFAAIGRPFVTASRAFHPANLSTQTR